MKKRYSRQPGYQKLSLEEARVLMKGSTIWVLVDVRDTEEYETWHLEGAVSIPGVEMTRLAPQMLPNKDVPVMVYCDTGGRSRVAAQILAALGYTTVYDLGGCPCPPEFCTPDPE